MAATEFHVTAYNPKGLNYDELHSTLPKAIQVVRTILARGGQEVHINGNLLPDHVIEAIRAA